MNLEGIDLSVLGPAMLAGLLVLATHVPLGREVLSRGIIFIDLAVAQVAGLGVVLAHAVADDVGRTVEQLAAGSAAMLAAIALRWVEKHWPRVQEAVIGSVFVLAATGALLLLAHDPHGAENLQDLLSGQILWVDGEQLTTVTIIYAALLACWFGLGWRYGLWFYVLFAVAVTASVQLVGVYLVFASLIIPALVIRNQSAVGGLWRGYALGATAYALGLLFSATLDLPSGPVIVWSLAICGTMLWWLWKPRWRV
jgi:zinc/manganese transport system permease protein